jgi:hypothetical protein
MNLNDKIIALRSVGRVRLLQHLPAFVHRHGRSVCPQASASC